MQGFLGEVSEKIDIANQEVLSSVNGMAKNISALKTSISGLGSQTSEILQAAKVITLSFFFLFYKNKVYKNGKSKIGMKT